MAHFAQINENNIITQVIVIDNNDCLDSNGIESETIGIQVCQELLGQETNWLQTSYNNSIRKNYAGIGYTYDETRDAFIPPQPFLSWVLNEETCLWESPIPYPDDNKEYSWNEETQTWDLIPE